MEYLTSNIIAINENELNDHKIDFINFKLNQSYPKNNVALKIDFKNDLKYSIACIKKLIRLREKNIHFSSYYNGKNVKYIISNYNQEIIDSLKAIEIQDIKEKYIFLYEKFCDELDEVWKKYNPCNFCNQVCAAGKNDKRYSNPDGCCARAFDLGFLKKNFAFLTEKDLFSCPYLGEKDGCTTQNSACKLFVCNYIKKNKLISLNPKKFIIYQCFFNSKQRLVLTYNFFKTKEQLLDKLLEKEHTPYFYYSSKMKYLILD